MITEGSGMSEREIDTHVEITFNVDTPQIVRLNHKDYPHTVFIISAGWDDMYHIIREYGDMDNFNHTLVSEDDVATMYGLEVLKKLK